jgi:hypothetical protein
MVSGAPATYTLTSGPMLRVCDGRSPGVWNWARETPIEATIKVGRQSDLVSSRHARAINTLERVLAVERPSPCPPVGIAHAAPGCSVRCPERAIHPSEASADMWLGNAGLSLNGLGDRRRSTRHPIARVDG